MLGVRKRTWAEIDLDAAKHNFTQVKTAANTAVCCVVKANGYGHGAVVLSRLFESLGADCLAVSNIEEALQLRRNNISLPILILGYTPCECATLLCKNGITQCVYSLDYAIDLNREAEKNNCVVSVHVKIDTGMGRLGFIKETEASRLTELKSLDITGVFTHFAVADEGEKGKEYTLAQLERFKILANSLEKALDKKLIRHCANSAAIFDYPETHLDMVRAGIVLYGLPPSSEIINKPELKPVMTLKTVISHLKEIEKGDSVSYGRTFTADKKMKVATVPVGYADGFPRRAGGNYSFEVNGKQAALLGRVCMDQIMLDVTDIDVSVGDEVTVFGNNKATADSLAKVTDTINYEIVCAVGERVPRFYIQNGWVTDIVDNLCDE